MGMTLCTKIVTRSQSTLPEIERRTGFWREGKLAFFNDVIMGVFLGPLRLMLSSKVFLSQVTV